ncbi:DUF6339 family protein [Streptomyces sp. TRM70350]|uniref:DUF6339 family protein n=1 Tax=Streptomyces sp. TRM70350 TaxID=2856165 RepID=UPI001C45B83A|nr:DUF6339 family protein [Streptomyces sp. TRM70350]MBV7698740.1 hypothetical protein [Streptomyces sp. TRM70350]
MTTGNKFDIPEKLGRISDSVAAKVLTPSVVTGAPLPQAVLVSNSLAPLDDSSRWNAAEVRALLDEVMERFEAERPTASDAWLAPRLHYTLRMTRAEATDSGVWNFIALRVAPDFVRWRWGHEKDGRVVVGQAARFSGRWDIQCFSRLWWAAELFRDGEDYRPVVAACSNQDILNTALRLDMNNHRPTAQALVELLEKGTIRTGREVNGLVKAAAAAGSTLVYEVIAPDEPRDYEALQQWIESVDSDPVWNPNTLPQGPVDGSVPFRSIQRLTEWFERLFETAPVRGKEPREESEEGLISL